MTPRRRGIRFTRSVWTDRNPTGTVAAGSDAVIFTLRAQTVPELDWSPRLIVPAVAPGGG
ncbi:MAG: hypothetical protein V8T86_08455 [Victivallis sp.]